MPGISKIEKRKILGKIKEAKRCFFEAINKIDNFLAKLMKPKKKKKKRFTLPISGILKTTDPVDIKKIIHDENRSREIEILSLLMDRNIVKMSVLLSWIYRFNIILMKHLARLFCCYCR